MHISALKSLFKFSGGSLADSVTGELLIQGGNDDVSVLVSGTGYNMQQDQFLYMSGFNSNISTDMIISFWFKN